MRFPSLFVALIAVTATLGAQGVPSQLKTSEAEAQQDLVDLLPGSGVPFGSTAGKAFVALPAAARAAVVNASVLWMKTSVNSAAFKTAYAQARDQAKPTAPDARTVDQELKRRQDEQTKQLTDSRAMLNMLPADQRAGVQQMIQQTEAMLKSPDNQRMLRAQVEDDLKSERASYNEELEKWQERYPANPLVLVSRRLQQFMTASADVDFNAKLVKDENGKMRFENPAYEDKSHEWKMCFRAGREAVTAARTAAAAWLKELPQK